MRKILTILFSTFLIFNCCIFNFAMDEEPFIDINLSPHEAAIGDTSIIVDLTMEIPKEYSVTGYIINFEYNTDIMAMSNFQFNPTDGFFITDTDIQEVPYTLAWIGLNPIDNSEVYNCCTVIFQLKEPLSKDISYNISVSVEEMTDINGNNIENINIDNAVIYLGKLINTEVVFDATSNTIEKIETIIEVQTDIIENTTFVENSTQNFLQTAPQTIDNYYIVLIIMITAVIAIVIASFMYYKI